MHVEKMVEVCKSITEKTTGAYISTDDGRMWFLLMVNMPFLADRLDWGTSVRYPWWRLDGQTMDTCGLVREDGEQETDWVFTQPEWDGFVMAIVKFSDTGGAQ